MIVSTSSPYLGRRRMHMLINAFSSPLFSANMLHSQITFFLLRRVSRCVSPRTTAHVRVAMILGVIFFLSFLRLFFVFVKESRLLCVYFLIHFFSFLCISVCCFSRSHCVAAPKRTYRSRESGDFVTIIGLCVDSICPIISKMPTIYRT